MFFVSVFNIRNWTTGKVTERERGNLVPARAILRISKSRMIGIKYHNLISPSSFGRQPKVCVISQWKLLVFHQHGTAFLQ
jgi:hypothetical protein